MNDVRFEPYDHQSVDDPYPLFARMRDEVPLHRKAPASAVRGRDQLTVVPHAG